MKLWNSPGTLFRGKQLPPRRARVAAPPRLTLEILEDRLALSGSAIGPFNYADWRDQRFSIQQMTAVSPPAGQLPLPSAAAGQGQGFGPIIGLPKVFADYPYRGTGYSVAIIDTGIDYNNPALGGGWGHRVIAGYNFVKNTSDPMDDNGHGTHVAGIIGSSDSLYTGIAPDVNLIALKVLDASGSGTYGAVDQALQWVAAHQAQYNIVAVNLSMGAGNYSSNPYTYLESDFATLKSEGVFIAAASGNSFYTVDSQQGLAYPSISPQTVSVGAVWDGNFGAVSWVSGARDNSTAADNIASFTQRSSALDLLAPGALITSTYLNNTFKKMAGTSMAAPVVAGAAAILHQALDARGQHAQANQDYILGLMQSTGVSLTDGDDENDNVINTGLRFKRLDLYAALNSIRPATNIPPTLGAIPNQTMTAGRPLVISLPASDGNNDKLTFSGRATGSGNSQVYQTGQQFGLRYGGSYFLNSLGQNEKWILGSNSQWYCLMPNGDLRRWTGNPGDTLAAAALVATLSPAVYNDPTQLWTPPSTTNPPVTFAFTGNQLTLQCDPSFRGSFTVVVTVSDGIANASQSFTVNVTNRAPVLGAIANQTMKHGKSLTIGLTAGAADGDILTLAAKTVTPSQQALNLAQTLGLTYTGNYWTNYYGQGEKWLRGGAAGPWYCLLANGELRRAGTSAANMLAADSLVAALDPNYYLEPGLLWNAPNYAAPQVAYSFNGNQLTMVPAATFAGTFLVEVSAGVGAATARQMFTVTVTDIAPALGNLVSQAQSQSQGQNSRVYNLSAGDADGDTITFSARAAAFNQLAYDVSRQYGLTFTGNYLAGSWGAQEKWLKGRDGLWYCILPSGELRQGRATMADTLKADALIATLDSAFYKDPSLLWNAQTPVAPRVTVVVQGNQLTVTAVSGYHGTFYVEVTASDGFTGGKRSYLVTV